MNTYLKRCHSQLITSKWSTYIFFSLIIAGLIGVFSFSSAPHYTEGIFAATNNTFSYQGWQNLSLRSVLQENSLYQTTNLLKDEKVIDQMKVIITAYSSSPQETDSDPFITASGKYVEDGIIANNLLPFGTKIKIPKIFGDKVFVVEDRMNSRKGDYHFDIWFPSRSQAINFGAEIATLQVIQEG